MDTILGPAMIKRDVENKDDGAPFYLDLNEIAYAAAIDNAALIFLKGSSTPIRLPASKSMTAEEVVGLVIKEKWAQYKEFNAAVERTEKELAQLKRDLSRRGGSFTRPGGAILQ